MPLPLHIALRYLRSPKSHSVINLVGWVSCLAVAVPVVAMVVIMSLQNGLSDFIHSIYRDFDSQLRITPIEGKFFEASEIDLSQLERLPGINAISATIQENVLLRYDDRDFIATLRGVDSLYQQTVDIENRVSHGQYLLQRGDLQYTLIGQGIAYELGVSLASQQPLEVYAIRPMATSSVIPTKIYNESHLIPSGIYSLDQQTDSRYIFSSIEFAQKLLGRSGQLSSLELSISDNIKEADLVEAIKKIVGSDFKVEDRYQQKALIYRTVNQEKWIVYLLLIMVMAIATLSLAGSVVMLISDKRAQIDTLSTMGASLKLRQNIFIIQGMVIVAVGIVAGVVIGLILSLVQQHLGILQFSGNSFLLNSYPIRVDWREIMLIIISVSTIGGLITIITTKNTITK